MNIQQLKQFKILVIGDACDDVYHMGTCDRISPEAPVPIFRENTSFTRPGMSSNVISNLKSLGAVVEYYHNKEVLKKHRFIDSRFKQHLLRVDTGEEQKIIPFDIEKISHNQYDIIVISDYNKGFLPKEVCSYICRFAKSKNIPLFVDSKKRDLNCFENCYIKINKSEYDNLMNKPESLEFIVTLGDKGVMHRDKIYPTDQVEVFDVCGAGDVFLSTLILFFLLTSDLRYAIMKANKCASYSVTKLGTYVITKKDIKDLFKENER